MEHVEDPSEEEIEYRTPPEIQDKAHDVSLNLLPEKSRGKYQLQYIIIAVMLCLCRKKSNV
jgi:hypothetical protein